LTPKECKVEKRPRGRRIKEKKLGEGTRNTHRSSSETAYASLHLRAEGKNDQRKGTQLKESCIWEEVKRS